MFETTNQIVEMEVRSDNEDSTGQQKLLNHQSSRVLAYEDFLK